MEKLLLKMQILNEAIKTYSMIVIQGIVYSACIVVFYHLFTHNIGVVVKEDKACYIYQKRK